MAFLSSLDIAGSGLTANKKRLDTIAENITNRETLRTQEGGPYRRKLTVFQEIAGKETRSFRNLLRGARERRENVQHGGVMVAEVIEDQSDFVPVYDPTHPDANEEGYVMMPNVDTTMEMVDAMAATRSYSANLAAFEAIKSIAGKALEIGR